MEKIQKIWRPHDGKLTTRLTVIYGLILCILVSLFIGALNEAKKETEETVRDTIANTLNIYESDYESQLTTAGLMMDEIYSQVDALATLGVSDQRASYFARYTLSQDMEEKVNSSGPIDCIAIYYDGGILRQYANDTASQRRIQLWDYLRENEQLFTQTLGSDQSKWYLLEIEGEYCLGNVYRTSGCTLLTLLRVEKLFANLSGYDEPQGAYALLSGEGELVLHSAGEPDRNLFPWKNAGAGRYTDYLIETRRLENGSLQLMFYEKM